MSALLVAATPYLLWGWVLHLVADLFLQNAHMSEHKRDLRHPAGWTHAAVHGVLLLLVFPPLVALALAVSHLLIDTRTPLVWWRRVYRQSTVTDASHPALHAFAFAQDQACHVLCLAAAALLVAH